MILNLSQKQDVLKITNKGYFLHYSDEGLSMKGCVCSRNTDLYSSFFRRKYSVLFQHYVSPLFAVPLSLSLSPTMSLSSLYLSIYHSNTRTIIEIKCVHLMQTSVSIQNIQISLSHTHTHTQMYSTTSLSHTLSHKPLPLPVPHKTFSRSLKNLSLSL